MFNSIPETATTARHEFVPFLWLKFTELDYDDVRCSTDYYWYLKEVNAVRIDTEGNLRNVSMGILEGD